MKLKWQKPELIPAVELGNETKFWMAVEVNRNGEIKVLTFLAQYQNRPFDQEKYDNNIDGFDDDCLVDVDGEFTMQDYLFIGGDRCGDRITINKLLNDVEMYLRESNEDHPTIQRYVKTPIRYDNGKRDWVFILNGLSIDEASKLLDKYQN